MEKLIELVYYYNSHLEKGKIGIGLTTSVKENGREVPFDKEKEIRKYENYIISKKYGFIERLVQNNKIVWRGSDLWYSIAVINGWGEDIDIIRTFDDYEQLLMILAIQDKPIDFLISILK